MEPVWVPSELSVGVQRQQDELRPPSGGGEPASDALRFQPRSSGPRVWGIHKWIAYDRLSGDVVGRGGLSRTPVDDDWGQVGALLPDEPWVRTSRADGPGPAVHAGWLEVGWAIRGRYWGRGFASEIGRAGLAVTFDVLRAKAVVSCTEGRNVRSRAVMERIGMRYAGEIRGRGVVEGLPGEQEDAPYSVCVMLSGEWRSTRGDDLSPRSEPS